MTAPIACGFCAAPLEAKSADGLMGLVDCSACGKLVQLDAQVLAGDAKSTAVKLAGLSCKRCDKPLVRAQVNAQYGVAKCAGCGIINDLGGRYRVAKLTLAKKSAAEASARKVSQPRMFEVLELPGALEISWREPSTIGWALLPMMLAVFGGLFLAANNFITPNMWLGAMAGGALWFLYGIAVAYSGRLYIVAGKEALTVERRPLWWPKTVVPRLQVSQLFVRETTHVDENWGKTYQKWWLAAVVSGRKRPLVLTPDFNDPSLPRYLEQELERYLRIKDRLLPSNYEG